MLQCHPEHVSLVTPVTNRSTDTGNSQHNVILHFIIDVKNRGNVTMQCNAILLSQKMALALSKNKMCKALLLSRRESMVCDVMRCILHFLMYYRCHKYDFCQKKIHNQYVSMKNSDKACCLLIYAGFVSGFKLWVVGGGGSIMLQTYSANHHSPLSHHMD